MKIFSSNDVPCPVCNAEPGAKCTFWYGSGRRRFKREMHGTHAKRCRDSNAAQRAYNTLMESD